MGSIMEVVPGGLGMGAACAIPGAVNYRVKKWGVMRLATTPVQPAIAALAAFAAHGGAPCEL